VIECEKCGWNVIEIWNLIFEKWGWNLEFVIWNLKSVF